MPYTKCKLGNVAVSIKRKSDSKDYPIMMISSTDGFINQIDRYSKDNAGSSKSKYTLLYFSELSYNHGNSKTKRFGSIFALKEPAALVPFVYHSFKIEKQNPFYFARYLNLPMHDRYLIKVISSGARMDGLLNINSKDFFNMPIQFPNLDEQNYIESFFNLIDNKILIIQKKLQALKKYKNGLLKIISKTGEKHTLSELLKEVNLKTENNNECPILSSTNNGLFFQSDYFNHQVASDNNIGYKIIKRNQIVFSPQNLWLGNINLNDICEKGAVSPSYKVYSLNFDLVDPYYLIDYLKSPYMLYQYKRSSEQGASIVRRNLDINSFLKILINVPSLENQQVFRKIHNYISNMKILLFNLQKIRKYLLNNLFI